MTKNKNNQPVVLLSTTRNNINDALYYGSVYLASEDKIYFHKGYSKENLYFIRSLAKPLQAAIIADTNIEKDLNIKNKELAIMTGSHAGSQKHIELLKNICLKYKIKQQELEIIPQKPLDSRNFKGHPLKLHNNCSGKHILMVLMCKYLGINPKGYTNENHPIQKLIQKKQEELSGNKAEILSYDGCSTPLWAINANGIIRSYYNLINEPKYSNIIKSALKYPEYFGGYNRLDTEIIKLSKGRLYTKVGAGGFVIICNIKENKILLIKLTQNNNPIRRLIALDILNKLKWLDYNQEEYEYNQKNTPVAKYCYEITFN